MNFSYIKTLGGTAPFENHSIYSLKLIETRMKTGKKLSYRKKWQIACRDKGTPAESEG